MSILSKIKSKFSPKKTQKLPQTKAPIVQNLSKFNLSNIPKPTGIGKPVIANNKMVVNGKVVGSAQTKAPILKENITYGGTKMWRGDKAIGSSEINAALPGKYVQDTRKRSGRSNEVTYGDNNTMYRNGVPVGSYEPKGATPMKATPTARVNGGATSTSSAGGNSFGSSATPTTYGGGMSMDTTSVADYSAKDNETLKALQEESNKLKGNDREEMDRKIARKFKDQLDFIKQAKAIAVEEAKRANMEKSNTQRAIQAAAGNLGTEFGAGVQQKVGVSNTNDITKAQLPYVEQELALTQEMQKEKQDRMKNFVITSAFKEGITDPMKVADYAAKNGVELTLDDLQQFSKFGSGAGETGTLSFADAMKAGVPYGTTYEQLYGQTISSTGSKPLSGDAAKVLSIATSVIPEVEQLKAAMNKNYRKTILGIKTGTDTTLVRLFESVADKVGRLRSGGAINVDEANSFKGQIARVMDLYQNDPSASINALNAIIAEANQVASSMQGQQSQTFNTASSFNNIDLNTVDSAIDALL